MSPARKLPPDTEAAKWHKLHTRDGLSYPQVADKMGIDSSCVDRWFKRLGYKTLPQWKRVQVAESRVDWKPLEGIKPVKGLRGYSAFTVRDGERIREFYNKNQYMRMTWIARHFGVDANTIQKIIRGETKFTRPNISETRWKEREML